MKTSVFPALAGSDESTGLGGVTRAQQSETADEATAVLGKAVTAVKADQAGALAAFGLEHAGACRRDFRFNHEGSP
jgi:hypothetical protein